MQASNPSTAARFSEIRSLSLLMLFSAFMRFVAAMDDSAIVAFIDSFSASRLNGRRRLPFLSFFFRSRSLSLSLSLSLEEDPKNEPEDDERLWSVLE